MIKLIHCTKYFCLASLSGLSFEIFVASSGVFNAATILSTVLKFALICPDVSNYACMALSLYCKTTRLDQWLDTPARVYHPHIVFDVKFEINNS